MGKFSKLPKDERDAVRRFVRDLASHGAEPNEHDLNNFVEALQKGDDSSFLDGLFGMFKRSGKKNGSQIENFFTVEATHARSDEFASEVSGEIGTGWNVRSRFCGNILFRRYTDSVLKNIELGYENMMEIGGLPSHVAIRTPQQLKRWVSLVKRDGSGDGKTPESDYFNTELGISRGVPDFEVEIANTAMLAPGQERNMVKINCRCYLETEDLRARVEKAGARFEPENDHFDVYAAVPFDEEAMGPVFAPAFNSMWLVYEDESKKKLKLWFVHSAKASGEPTGGFFGDAWGEEGMIWSRAGTKFHPLASENNAYRVTVSNSTTKKENGLQLKIESFYHKYDPDSRKPYITVTNEFRPATRKEVEEVVGKIGVDDMWTSTQWKKKYMAMVMKGALVQEIMGTYFPQRSDAENFAALDDIGEEDARTRVKTGRAKTLEEAYEQITKERSENPLSAITKIAGPALQILDEAPFWSDAMWEKMPEVTAESVGEDTGHSSRSDKARKDLERKRKNQ